MAAKKLARFSPDRPRRPRGRPAHSTARGIFILFWSWHRAGNHLGQARHTHFPLALWPGKIPPMMDAAVVATLLARSLTTTRVCLPPYHHTTHPEPDSLQTRRSPQWGFWLARVALLQFLASNAPPAPALASSRRAAGGGARPVWHLAVMLGATTGFSAAAELLDANVQMTREEEREREGARSQKIVPLMRLFLVGRRRLSV